MQIKIRVNCKQRVASLGVQWETGI